MGTSSPSPKRSRAPNFLAHFYCSQTDVCIRIQLRTEVGLQPVRHCVRWGPSSPPLKGHSPLQFWANVRCGQMAGWTKMSFGMEIGLSPGDCVRWGPSSPSEKKYSSHPIFGPCLLWPSGWMDQDATWYEGKPRPRRRCIRWGRSSPKRNTAPVFGPCPLLPNDWMDEDAT